MVSVVKVLAYGKGGVTDSSAFSDRPTTEHWSLLPKKGREKKNEIQGEGGPVDALPFTPISVIFSSHDV